MTRKHKPQTAHTHKKRSPAHSGKPMRPASDKAVAALASLRERERPRNGPLPKKPAAGARASLAHPKLNDSARPADARPAGLKAAADKLPVALERGVPVMPEGRQCRLKVLVREGEIRIAKRIEEGLDAVRSALAMYPPTYDFLLRAYEPVKAGQARLVDVIVGFIDPNAPDVIAQPQNPTKVELPTAAEK